MLSYSRSKKFKNFQFPATFTNILFKYFLHLKNEIFEKVEYLHDHEEFDIGNGIVIFSERSSFRKANNF